MIGIEGKERLSELRKKGLEALGKPRMEISCNSIWETTDNIHETALMIAKCSKNIANKLTYELGTEMEVIEVDRPGLYEYKISEMDENNFLITFQVIKNYSTEGSTVKLSYYHGQLEYNHVGDKMFSDYIVNMLDDIIADEFDK